MAVVNIELCILQAIIVAHDFGMFHFELLGDVFPSVRSELQQAFDDAYDLTLRLRTTGVACPHSLELCQYPWGSISGVLPNN